MDAFVGEMLRAIVLGYPLVEPPRTCHATLAKCVAKRCRCMLKTWERALKLGAPVDATRIQRCADKFFDPIHARGCVDKVYAKQDPAKPATLCDVPDDGAELAATLDAYIAALVDAVTGLPTPTPTPTATGTPVPTPTVTGPSLPTATVAPLPTLTPIATPTPNGGCPSALIFDGGDGDAIDHDLGFSGLAHDMPGPLLGPLTVGVTNCTGTSPSCGTCDLAGPIPNVSGFDNRRCACDSSARCTTSSDCPAGCPCRFFLGPPQSAEVGGIGTCLVHVVAGAVTGTSDLDTGDTALMLPIESSVSFDFAFPPLSITGCPDCVGDVTPNDDVRDGVCSGGPRDGLPCDTHAHSALFSGDASLDCPAPAALAVFTPGILPLSTTPATLSIAASSPSCRSGGFSSRTCLCDTCATPGAEPCNADADCPGGATDSCGGLRCLAGPDHGSPCTSDTDCAAPGACGRPGEAPKPNGCNDGICTATTNDEGECQTTFDALCGPAERLRACLSDSDCPVPGDTCQYYNRECFLDDNVTGTGAASPTNPILGAVTCHGPSGSPAANAVLGLPGPVRVEIPTTIAPF